MISIHDKAVITAEASEAAGDQGAFWEMHDLLYERQQEWASKPLEEMPTVLSGYAEELGLDTEAFDEALADGTYNEKVMAAYNSAETGTPQVFVRRFPEPQGLWRISEGQGLFPRWSGAGDAVFYWSSPGSVDSLYVARVRTDPSVVVESRDVIVTGEFDFDDSDFDPVTERFVVVQNVGEGGGAADEGLLVVNWFTELAERVGEERNR